MSRAFVKEQDGDADGQALPDRPVSMHRNLVTLNGLAQIDAEIASLRQDLTNATADGHTSAMAAAARDLRYWTARRASAELVESVPSRKVRFGSTVTIERNDGRRQTFRIVGEDEANPSAGTLSYVAPLARVLIGKTEGDDVEFMGETIAIIHQV